MAISNIYPVIVPSPYGLKTVNFYLVKNQLSLSLIDAGYNDETSWNALQDVLKKHDFILNDLTEIILTHHHVDHVGLVNRIVSKHPIPIYVSPLSIPRLKREPSFMKMRIRFFTNLYREMGCGEIGDKQVSYLEKSFVKNSDRAINGDLVEICERQLLHFDVLEVPGHAPDQLAFWKPSEKWMFGGDLVIEHISSNAIVEPDEDGNRIPSLTEHVKSLKRVLELDLEKIYSGHGEVIEEPYRLIEKRLTRIDEKSERILLLIQSGIRTGSELALEMYKGKYETEFSLVMSEIIGQLDYLEKQHKVSKKMINGVWHYFGE